jgi:hypothetical protein
MLELELTPTNLLAEDETLKSLHLVGDLSEMATGITEFIDDCDDGIDLDGEEVSTINGRSVKPCDDSEKPPDSDVSATTSGPVMSTRRGKGRTVAVRQRMRSLMSRLSSSREALFIKEALRFKRAPAADSEVNNNCSQDSGAASDCADGRSMTGSERCQSNGNLTFDSIDPARRSSSGAPKKAKSMSLPRHLICPINMPWRRHDVHEDDDDDREEDVDESLSDLGRFSSASGGAPSPTSSSRSPADRSISLENLGTSSSLSCSNPCGDVVSGDMTFRKSTADIFRFTTV